MKEGPTDMDDASFAQAILAMRRTLYRVSYGLLAEEQDRLDAVQEALARAWEKRRTLREERYVRTWVVRILINECHTILRRRKRLFSLDAQPERSVPEGADAALHDAVLSLPDALRLPIILHYMEGYSIQEIARMLRLPHGTVATRMHRARAQLRRTLGEEAIEEVSPHA